MSQMITPRFAEHTLPVLDAGVFEENMKQEAIFEEIALEIENLMRISTEAEVFVGSVSR